MEQKKQYRRQIKQQQKEENQKLKEERKIKKQQQQKLKAETQTNSPEDEQQPPLEETTTSTEISNISNCKEITQEKKNEKQKKISSLDPSEFMDELYDCLHAFKSDIHENETSSSTSLNEITLYPSPIPFERHLSSLNLCNPIK